MDLTTGPLVFFFVFFSHVMRKIERTFTRLICQSNAAAAAGLCLLGCSGDMFIYPRANLASAVLGRTPLRPVIGCRGYLGIWHIITAAK